MIDARPDPTALLREVQAQEKRQGRGKLKIFFGASPGVGKTYAMLTQARQLYTDGVDVLVGIVETHKRSEIAELLLGMEILPRRDVGYRETTLSEFDLETALERKPQILLVDELAHTNAPGSRFEKRWQDVEALLENGIDVYTTLNVQHLESLNDVVSRITGIEVRETVPDSVFVQADEVELIDLPPDSLLERLKQGRVYLPEIVARAASNFFRKGNLAALRELALRRTAEWVDAQMQSYKQEHRISRVWAAGERILVHVDDSPLSARIVRAAKRLAVATRAELIAVSVETPESLRLTKEDRDRLVATLRLAESLDAETVTLSGRDVVDELVRYAQSRNVSKIAIGKEIQPLWREILFGSPVTRLIRRSGDIELYVVSGDEEDETVRSPASRFRARSNWRAYVAAAGIVALCTGVDYLMFRRFDLANLAMIYLFGVVLAAATCGRGPSVIASILAVTALDFFFVPPRLDLAISDTQYLITFVVMLLVALLTSTLTVRIKDQAESAREREHLTAALYAMTRELAASRDFEDLIANATRHIRETFASSVAVLLPDDAGILHVPPEDRMAFEIDTSDKGVAQWVHDHGRMAGRGTSTLPGARALYLPLRAAQGKVGVLGVRIEDDADPFPAKQLYLLETFANQLALAIERRRILAETQQAKLQAETERLRSALLSSVSHDLRTPLAAITGAASSLVEDRSALDDETQRELCRSIYDEAERLNKLIGNLVFATRLEAGNVVLRKEWLSLEEVVGSALHRLRESLKSRAVKTTIRSDLPMVHADGALLEQVVLNLLENSLRYTPAGSPIEIAAWSTDKALVLKIADRGAGLPAGTEQRVFERFYRGTAASGTAGMGLGLTICRGIVTAHGGRIWAENEPQGGAAFYVSLPLPESGPPPSREAPAP